MTERRFTPESVDALIPQLVPIVERAMERHQQATALGHELRDEQERIQRSGGSLVDRRDWKARAERLDGLTIEVRGALQEILDMGGVTKDLEMGLVDFPGEVDGAIVNLCWRYGETSVRFWHGLDEGYAQRKPLP